MRTILVTGANGFIGRNLIAHLRERGDLNVRGYDTDNSASELEGWAAESEVVVHLAGVNRPEREEDYTVGNVGFSETLQRTLAHAGRKPHVIFASSVQADLDNAYGRSKRAAEDLWTQFATAGGAVLTVFRFKNVFGKWCRPNYNSVVATFCHNVAHDLPIAINDPERLLELVYIDDVVAALIREICERPKRSMVFAGQDEIPSYCISLEDLGARVQAFGQMRDNLMIPDFSVRFNQQLYATYLSYLEPSRWSYGLEKKTDPRGSLAEFTKSRTFGQIFISHTAPGVTRGNHYHHTKTEKFLIVCGEGLIRLRAIEGGEITELRIRGEDYRVVDIPPGCAHSITNVGQSALTTLFWASEIFEPDRPDTRSLPVDPPATS